MNKQAIKNLMETFEQDESAPGGKVDACLYVQDMLTLLRALLDEPKPANPWQTTRMRELLDEGTRHP